MADTVLYIDTENWTCEQVFDKPSSDTAATPRARCWVGVLFWCTPECFLPFADDSALISAAISQRYVLVLQVLTEVLLNAIIDHLNFKITWLVSGVL